MSRKYPSPCFEFHLLRIYSFFLLRERNSLHLNSVHFINKTTEEQNKDTNIKKGETKMENTSQTRYQRVDKLFFLSKEGSKQVQDILVTVKGKLHACHR